MKKMLINFRNALALTISLMGSNYFLNAQCVRIINPSADSHVWSLPANVNTNFGTLNRIEAGTWTWGGVQASTRTFIQFDLSSIPTNAVVTQATLTLPVLPGPIASQSLTFSNAATISRVSANWAENTINWTSQPGIVAAGAAALPQGTTTPNINVLTMVQNMVANPLTNFGFRIQQNTENTYGYWTFGSRENATAANRPSLSVTYTIPNLPALSFVPAPPTSVCPNTVVNYTVAPLVPPNLFGAVYTWQVDGVTVPGATTNTFSRNWTVADVGAHVVRVSVTACGATNPSPWLSSNITVNPLPVVPAITGNTTVCVNQYTPLSNTVAGGVWSSSNTSVATINQFGLVQGISPGVVTITYTVTSAQGCSTSVTTPVTVNGTLVFSIVGPSIVCPNTTGQSYSVSPAVVGADYTWNIQDAPNVGVSFPVSGSTQTLLTIPSSVTNGQFTLRCQGLNACGASTIVSKIITLSTDVPPSPNVICTGTSGSNNCVNLEVTNSAGYTVEWLVNNVVQSTATSFVRPLSTVVICRLTSASGCTASTAYSPAVVCTYAARYAEEYSDDLVELPTNMPYVIYPNPSKGVFKINSKGQIGTASIYSSTGTLVKEIELNESLNEYTVEIGTPGMYNIQIKSEGETRGYKIVIQ